MPPYVGGNAALAAARAECCALAAAFFFGGGGGGARWASLRSLGAGSRHPPCSLPRARRPLAPSHPTPHAASQTARRLLLPAHTGCPLPPLCPRHSLGCVKPPRYARLLRTGCPLPLLVSFAPPSLRKSNYLYAPCHCCGIKNGSLFSSGTVENPSARTCNYVK